jgi:hypothetical protein
MPIVKRRDMLVQVVLFIITFGLYGLYWFYATASEMKGLLNDPDVSPGLLTLFSVLPFLNFYAIYKYSDLYEDVADDHLNLWILFILWLVFCPAVWFIVQTQLNRKATSLNPAMA